MLSAAQPARFTATRKKPSIWLLLPVLLLVGLSLLPLLYVGTKAWQAGWTEALHLLWRPYVFGLMRNTLLLMVGVTLTCALVGLSLAWLLERSNLPGRRLWGVILCLPFAVPAFVSSFTWVSLSASFEGLGGAILVMSLSKYPLIFLPVAATLRNLDPALEESARTLGQNRWGVFVKITLPLLWPSLLAGSLLIALHMLVEFGALSIIGLQTFTTAIYQQFELEFSNANAAMLSAVLLVLGLLWLAVAAMSRYSSLASLSAAVLSPVVYVLASGLLWNAERPVTGAIVVMAALLVWRHKENIIRLMQGKESRLGSKGKDKGAPAVAAVKAPHKKHKRH